MNNGDGNGKTPYNAPQLRQLDPHEVIHKLMAQLTGPLGKTSEERVANAAEQIRGVLERLPAEERDEAIHCVIGARGSNWVKKAHWSP